MDGAKRALIAKLSKMPFQMKFCFHPDASPLACSANIVRAHTIPRAGSLTKIARDAHVLAYRFSDIFQIERDGFAFREIGIGAASTFFGFCANHDGPLFAPLETVDFAATPEQVFLLHYRALAKELYAKRGHGRTIAEQIKMILALSRGRSPGDARALAAGLERSRSLVRASIRDLESAKASLVEAWQRKNFATVAARVLWFDSTPPFMCSGAFFPIFSATGEPIQNLDNLERRAQLASISTIAAGGSEGAAILAYDSRDELAATFAASVVSSPDREHVWANLVFFSLENVVVSPSWWDSVPESDKEQVQRRSRDAFNPLTPFRSDQLSAPIPHLATPRITNATFMS